MARTAKKTTAKKTKAKTTAKTAAAKKANTKTAEVKANNSSDRSVTKQRLYKFNLFAAAANLIFAVISVLFVSKQTADITTAYVTKNEVAGASAFGPAYKILATAEIRYLLAGIFVISAIFSLLLATKLRRNYETGVGNSSPAIRWVFSGITLGLILAFVSLLAGIGDVAALILISGLIFTTCVLAWANERDNKAAKKNYAVFSLSVVTGILAWIPLAVSLKDTYIYGDVNFGWQVYALAIVVLVGFISFARNQYKHAKNGISAKGYLQLEGTYLSVDFLIKLAVLVVILLALHK